MIAKQLRGMLSANLMMTSCGILAYSLGKASRKFRRVVCSAGRKCAPSDQPVVTLTEMFSDA